MKGPYFNVDYPQLHRSRQNQLFPIVRKLRRFSRDTMVLRARYLCWLLNAQWLFAMRFLHEFEGVFEAELGFWLVFSRMFEALGMPRGFLEKLW